MNTHTNTATGAGTSAAQYHARTTRETTIRWNAQFWDSVTEAKIPAGTLVKLDLCAIDISQGLIQERYVYTRNSVPRFVTAHTEPLANGYAACGSILTADLELVDGRAA